MSLFIHIMSNDWNQRIRLNGLMKDSKDAFERIYYSLVNQPHYINPQAVEKSIKEISINTNLKSEITYIENSIAALKNLEKIIKNEEKRREITAKLASSEQQKMIKVSVKRLFIVKYVNKKASL